MRLCPVTPPHTVLLIFTVRFCFINILNIKKISTSLRGKLLCALALGEIQTAKQQVKTNTNIGEGSSSSLEVNSQEPKNEAETANAEFVLATGQPIQNCAILDECNILSIDGQSYSAAPVNDNIIIIDMEKMNSELLSGTWQFYYFSSDTVYTQHLKSFNIVATAGNQQIMQGNISPNRCNKYLSLNEEQFATEQESEIELENIVQGCLRSLPGEYNDILPLDVQPVAVQELINRTFA